MTNLQEARHVSVSINRPPDEVYDFASNPENLPKWATGLGAAIKKTDGEWVAEGSTGKVKIRFAEKNRFGILDHEVTPEPGEKVYVPMRVLPNGGGSEVVLTLFRRPEMSDKKFSEDAEWVRKDLNILKSLLEK